MRLIDRLDGMTLENLHDLRKRVLGQGRYSDIIRNDARRLELLTAINKAIAAKTPHAGDCECRVCHLRNIRQLSEFATRSTILVLEG